MVTKVWYSINQRSETNIRCTTLDRDQQSRARWVSSLPHNTGAACDAPELLYSIMYVVSSVLFGGETSPLKLLFGVLLRGDVPAPRFWFPAGRLCGRLLAVRRSSLRGDRCIGECGRGAFSGGCGCLPWLFLCLKLGWEGDVDEEMLEAVALYSIVANDGADGTGGWMDLAGGGG